MTRRSCPHAPKILTENLRYPFGKWIVTCSTDHPDHPDHADSGLSKLSNISLGSNYISAFLESSNPGLLWLDVPHPWSLSGAKRRERGDCFLSLVMDWIIPPFPTFSTSKWYIYIYTHLLVLQKSTDGSLF